MKRGKRLCALLLALILMVPGTITEVSALDVYGEPVSIYVVLPEETKKYQVYEMDDDLYFNVDQLAEISGYSVQKLQGNDYVDLCRGTKTIRLNAKTHTLHQILRGVEVDTMTIFDTEEDSRVYYAGSHVLPYLNVTCDVRAGKLVVVRDVVSYWELVDDFNIDDFKFSFSECCEAIGVNSDALRLEAFFKRQMLSTVYYMEGANEGFGSYTDYYTVFDQFMQDYSSADPAGEKIIEALQGADKINSYLEALQGLKGIPSDYGFMSDLFANLDHLENALDLVSYYTAFHADNEMKVQILDTIFDLAESDAFTEECETAANVVSVSYQHFWIGLFFKGVDFIAKDLVNKLDDMVATAATGGAFAVALAAADMVAELDKSWTEAIDDTRTHMHLMSGTKYYIKDGFCYDRYGSDGLEDKIGFIILYLNSYEQCYKAMCTYMENNRSKYDADVYQEFKTKALIAQDWQGDFQLAYMSRYNDSMDENTKGDGSTYRTRMSDDLVKLFIQLRQHRPSSASMTYVEYAIILDRLRDWNARNLEWTFVNIDQDDTMEMLAVCDLDPNLERNYQSTQLLFDATNGNSWANTMTGAAGGANYARSTDGSEWYWSSGYYTAGNEYMDYWTWDGNQWNRAGYYDVHTGEEYAGQGGTVTEEEYFWKGDFLDSQEEYYRMTDGITANSLFDSPDLADFTIKGDPTALFEELDSYMQSRNRFLRSEQVDVNQDGRQDRVIALSSGAHMWFDYIEIKDAWYDEPYTQDLEAHLTLVVAEDVEEGIRIRVVTIRPENVQGQTYTLEGDTLTIGDSVYKYRSTGDVYIPEGTEFWADLFTGENQEEETVNTDDPDLPAEEAVTLMEVVFMDKKGVRRTLDAYQEQGTGQDVGSLNQTPVTVIYDSDGIVSSVLAENTGGYAQIVGAFPLDSTFGELWYMIPSTSDWSEPVVTEGGYVTAFVYQEPVTGLEAYCELAFDGIEEDSSVKMIYIEWREG